MHYTYMYNLWQAGLFRQNTGAFRFYSQLYTFQSSGLGVNEIPNWDLFVALFNSIEDTHNKGTEGKSFEK